jgi:hypothetical protein
MKPGRMRYKLGSIDIDLTPEAERSVLGTHSPSYLFASTSFMCSNSSLSRSSRSRIFL